MDSNVGRFDRSVRVVAGLGLVAVAVATAAGAVAVNTYAGGVAFWTGLLLLGTGLARWCPLYELFGLATGGAKRHA
ncbi:MAG: DUF2892 domain-containing protein [Halobacteriaceae archaeon]